MENFILEVTEEACTVHTGIGPDALWHAFCVKINAAVLCM